MKKKTLNDF